VNCPGVGAGVGAAAALKYGALPLLVTETYAVAAESHAELFYHLLLLFSF
jgi:hypothetical protein